MIHPVIMIVLRPAVAMFNSGLVTAREAVAVLVAVHAIGRRMAKHHGVVRVQRLTRLPVIVSSIHAVVKSAAIDVIEVRRRNIPPLALLVALLLRRWCSVLLRAHRGYRKEGQSQC